MINIKFIYFDVGGVLIDWQYAFKTVTHKFKILISDFDKEWEKYDDEITKGKITPQEFWNKVRYDLDIKESEGFDFLENWIGDYKSIKETFDLIINLQNKFKIGILSNIYKGMVKRLIEKKLIPDISYNSVIESCEVGFRKPQKEIYQLAQNKIKAEGNEILLVDDREDFLKGAKDSGWNTFLFNPNDPKKSVEELRKALF